MAIMGGRRRAVIAVVGAVALLLGVGITIQVTRGGEEHDSPVAEKYSGADADRPSQGIANGGSGGESNDFLTAQSEYAWARTAPSGIVNPGAYSSAYAQLHGLSATGGAWSEITNAPYDADDPDYRDYYSNSSGGSGLVTGRITGIAADDSGDVYAAGADGGVWRSTTGGGHWTPIADALPSLSTGTLSLTKDGSLWYATGEANTGGTTYVGSGVYRLANPKTGVFSAANRVGGNELESTTIGALRFTTDRVWAATLRGVWWHTLSNTTSHWTLSLAPNPGYEPTELAAYAQNPADGALFGTITTAGDSNAAYKNIANDVAPDPNDPTHIVAAAGWRSGDTYNGFYETHNSGATWSKINPTGSLPAEDIGYVSFAYAKDGSKLYAINESPTLLNKLSGTVNSYLDGIYVSNNGSITGPWSKIADSQKLANSGSALKQAIGGKGYGPGIQAWYNQFITVDPTDPNHVYAGLEEVYETHNGGSSWSTVGPYWNFYFSCWTQDSLYPPDGSKGCPQTTHSDQHSVAIGTVNGTPSVFVGNDGGIYRRPIAGSVDSAGHATDWTSLNDGTIDALQYYSVGVGKIAGNGTRPDLGTGDGVLVSGGMQDNGGSLIRPGAPKMVSNFGGDGGDVLVDPNNGCNIVQEYVDLTMEVTQTCANPGPGHPNAFVDTTDATTFNISPPDINARFIAPFAASATDTNQWVAGGNSLWYQNKGFAIRSGREWSKIYTFASPGQVATATAFSGNHVIAGWCGPCNNSGFASGVVIGTHQPDGSWTWQTVAGGTLPSRYIGGVTIDQANPNHMIVVMNGFSRHFTEGPGAGVGHVFETTDGGTTWADIDGPTFPDVPANSVRITPSGGLVVGTDLGVLYRPVGGAWTRLGSNFPTTVAMYVTLGPDGNVYAATHGRGIWRIATP
jgi:photosystem II stability/assembly factor-like uncharacterized protein